MSKESLQPRRPSNLPFQNKPRPLRTERVSAACVCMFLCGRWSSSSAPNCFLPRLLWTPWSSWSSWSSSSSSSSSSSPALSHIHSAFMSSFPPSKLSSYPAHFPLNLAAGSQCRSLRGTFHPPASHFHSTPLLSAASPVSLCLKPP